MGGARPSLWGHCPTSFERHKSFNCFNSLGRMPVLHGEFIRLAFLQCEDSPPLFVHNKSVTGSAGRKSRLSPCLSDLNLSHMEISLKRQCKLIVLPNTPFRKDLKDSQLPPALCECLPPSPDRSPRPASPQPRQAYS